MDDEYADLVLQLSDEEVANAVDGDLFSDEKDEAQEQKEAFAIKMKTIRPQFSEMQLERFNYFRTTTFEKNAVRDLMKKVTKKSANIAIVTAMISLTKIFVGEITESARTTMDECGEYGAIQPRHIREAFRKLKMANKIPYAKPNSSRVFRRYR